MTQSTWQERYDSWGESQIKRSPNGFADIKPGQLMLITTPSQLDAFIRTLPAGMGVDNKTLRRKLAEAHGAENACPVMTGFCMRIVAECVGERLDAGIDPSRVTPVWRAFPPGAPVLKKLENGKARMMALREAEGLAI